MGALQPLIEEARIKGGFNETPMDLGVKAHIVDPDYKEGVRNNALIFSGVYNPRTGVNETNEFSIAGDITKELDARNGSIQKLHAENTNLNIFQEEKVSVALVNKDAIFSATGEAITTSSNKFIGQVMAYPGDYGIGKNPESFAYYAGKKYFVDKSKGVILGLFGKSITELSAYDMRSFFRENLKKANKIYGMWDMRDKKYIVHAEGENLVTNGDFNNTNNNWTFDGNVTLDGNDAFFNVSGVTLSSIKQDNVFVIGKTYEVTYEITSQTQGGLNIRKFGVNDNTGIEMPTTVGVHTVSGVAYETYLEIKRRPGNNTIAKITNISANEVSNSMSNLSLTTKMPGSVNSFTLGFDEGSAGWISFYTFYPIGGGSIDGDFYTFDTVTSQLWKHYSNETRNSFRGKTSESSIDFVFNENPSLNKAFNSINYEGSDTWNISNLSTDTDTGANVAEYSVNNEDLIISAFKKFYNKYFANIINTSSSAPNEVIFGEDVSGVKGFFMKLRIKTISTALKELFAVSTNYNKNI